MKIKHPAVTSPFYELVKVVERPIPRRQIKYPSADIVAPDADAALEIVLADLRKYLEQSTGKPAR